MKTILVISFAGLVWGCGVRGRPRPPQFEHVAPQNTRNAPDLPQHSVDKSASPAQSAETGEECFSCNGTQNE